MDETKLLSRITVDPRIFGGKPIIRGRRLAVEHILGMLTAGSTEQEILEGHTAAVLVASIAHFGKFTIAQMKEHLAAAGIDVRL